LALSKTALITSTVLLSAPALAQKSTGEEPVLSFLVTPTSIEFRVPSGGCTRKAHFGVEIAKTKPLTVRLVRLTPDYCEAYLPQGVAIRFNYAEIGVGPTLTPQEQTTLTVENTVRSP
jgi:hypothetical protein